MSVDSINLLSSSSAVNKSSSKSVLSEETIKKLKALGLDPSDYTSEAAAKSAIKQAQAQQAATIQQGQSGTTTLEALRTRAEQLASVVGVSLISKGNSMDDILDKISERISTLQASAGTDSSILAKVQSYQAEYSSINNEYSQYEAAKNMTGATALANYYKAAFGF